MQDHAATADAGETLGHEVTMAPPGCWPELQDPRFLRLLRHWAECRQGVMMPRSAIDPAVLRNCLPNVWIYQYLPEADDFVCTLAGEAVNQAWGQSLIGKRVSQIMPPVMLGQLLYHRLLAMPALQVSRRRILPTEGLAQSAERLIVPLSRDDGSPYGIFGLTIYHLGQQTRFDDPRDIQGAVTLYDCNTLPASLPGA